MGKKFNLPINNLPSTLISLTLGECFNQPVNNLPNSLKYLHFNEKFNQPIDTQETFLTEKVSGAHHKFTERKFIGCNLPNSLIELTFTWGSKFNQSIENLPNSIIHLKLGREFSQSVNILPASLTHLTLDREFIKKNKKQLPKSIKITGW